MSSTSAKNRPIHIEVYANKNDTNEKTVKRFIRKFKKHNLKDLFMEKAHGAAFFEKKSDVNRRKRNLAKFKAKFQNVFDDE